MTDQIAYSEDSDEEVQGEYLWCLHCEQTYKRGEHRLSKGGLKYCPNCGASDLESWEWEIIRSANPEYPEVPEKGKEYIK